MLHEILGLLQVAVIVLDATGKFYDGDVARPLHGLGRLVARNGVLVEFDAETGAFRYAHKPPLNVQRLCDEIVLVCVAGRYARQRCGMHDGAQLTGKGARNTGADIL